MITIKNNLFFTLHVIRTVECSVCDCEGIGGFVEQLFQTCLLDSSQVLLLHTIKLNCPSDISSREN
jgi:hypothetical protein